MEKTSRVDALYIHVPFCSKICYYCDFCKVIYNQENGQLYLNALKKEAIPYQNYKFNSIYIGGGTPSALVAEQFDDLLKFAKSFLTTSGEFCVELNPEDFSFKKIDSLIKYGVNRVSIGVQTFNQTHLAKLNRGHKNQDVFNLIDALKKAGIFNISVDLIFGFFDQNETDLTTDLSTIISLDVPHVSLYPLTIEPHTYFDVKKIKAQDEEKQYSKYDLIYNYLIRHGYERYEVSNFARNKLYSKHNLKYWKGEHYLGLGPGAHGYLDDYRYANSKSITNYLKAEFKREVNVLKPKEVEFEHIMLNLRLNSGLNLIEFNKKFNHDFAKTYQIELNELIKEGLMANNGSQITITNKGIYISNYVISRLTKKLNY